MDKFNKLLVFIFFFLFVIVITEVCFVFFFKTGQNITSRITLPSSTIVSTLTPTPIPKDQAISPGELAALSKLKNDLLVASTMSNIFKGKIIEIDNQPGTVPGVLFNYVLKIVIKGSAGNTQNFYFNSTDLKSTKTFEKVDNTEKPSDIGSLKVGDNVMITYNFDMLAGFDTNILEIKIVKN